MVESAHRDHGAQVTDAPDATAPVVALLLALEQLPHEADAVRTTVEHAAAALGADVAALVTGGVVRSPLGSADVEALAAAAHGADHGADLVLAGAAPRAVLVAPCAALPHAVLLVARVAPREFTGREQLLLAGLATALSLAVRAGRAVEAERAGRQTSSTQAAEAVDLLSSLRERQVLLERLSRIQRSISSRQPLLKVLDAIVAGAAELLGDDIVGLRLVDAKDPRFMVLASTVGVPEELAASTRRQLVGQGIGGRAIQENRLVHTDSYATSVTPIPGFSQDGIAAAMAAPVRQGARAVGSLTVASRLARRSYSPSEQEVLTSFAEHVSLALNDAQSVEALHRAVDLATHQSRHDSLTGLPNRVLFLERLDRASDRSCLVGDEPLSVLFIDVDDFKLVNDSLGHLAGDELLTAVAGRVLGSVRGPDTVARLGGDEFAVLLERTGPVEAEHTAERVLRALDEPFELHGHTVHVRASIGLVTSPSGAVSADELLRDADVAMYSAKGAGKARFAVFEPAMRDRLQARTELEAELRRALEAGQFTVHYQPVLAAGSGRVTSTEALVRWQHPVRGLLEPDGFVPLAEDTGLIVALGAGVLREACRQTAAWRLLPALADLGVSVNLSPRQLQEPGLVDLVEDALRQTGLPPDALVLEITETVLVRDLTDATAQFDRLTALGVHVAVDDFGTGYSSLSYLSRLPVDLLKVDRSFIAGMSDEQPAGRLAEAVLSLAHSFGLATVAEGVETVEQATALVRLGCTMLQGHLFSPAVAPEQLPAVAARLGAAVPPWLSRGAG